MKEETLEILKCPTEEIYSFLFKAYLLRNKHFGIRVETCSIVNAKSGRCPSDCKFCAQSAKFKVPIKEYPLISEENLISVAENTFNAGVDRFSFVTSGVSPSKEDLKKIGKVIEKLKTKHPKLKLCASLGQLKKEELLYLKECGLDRYHHNLETSKEFYPTISSYQSWNDRFRTVEIAKEVGLSTCCGGIFGIGESDEDIVSLIESLKALQVDSVPVNFLHPIKGTPLASANYLTPTRCLKILSAIRVGLPDREIRVCGGREYNLRELQPFALLAANALMVGNYLTTKGRNLKEDARLIKDMGFKSNLRL